MMFASSDQLLTVDKVVDVLKKLLADPKTGRPSLTEWVAHFNAGRGSFLKRAEEALRLAAKEPVDVKGCRPILSITAEDVRANAGQHFTNQQVLAILNADWGHAANSTLPDSMGELIFQKALALGYRADRDAD